jgi:hypothetical protein
VGTEANLHVFALFTAVFKTVQGFGVPWFCMGPWFSPIFYRTRRTCRYIISMIIILNAIVFWIFSLVAKGHVFGQEKLNYTLD